MSAKESKAILKEVREAIKNEKYTEAIEKCEKILKDDSKNYMACLLLGAAYQNNNKVEATKYLRKAVEYSPGVPTVALQGLTNCAPAEELPKIYEQLLLQLGPEKSAEYYEKLYRLSENSQLTDECLGVFKKELRKSETENHPLILKYLAKIWINKEVENDDNELFKSALEHVMQDSTSDIHLTCCKRYLKLLYKLKDIQNCIRNACMVVEQYPKDIYAYEWICKIYCESYNTDVHIDVVQTLKESIDSYASNLLQLNENSTLGLVVQSIALFEKQQFVAARELLLRVQKLQSDYPAAVELLARTHLKLGAFQMAEPLCRTSEKLAKQYAICLSYSATKSKLEEAVGLLLKQNSEDDDVCAALARCYFKLNETSKIRELRLTPIIQAEFLLSPIEAVDLLKSHPDNETFCVLLLLGKLYMQLSKYTEALTCVLKATRLNPNWSTCFLYLGKIYFAINDAMRARKCFEKCISLNPMCEEAVHNLSSIYQQNAEEDLNVALLLNTLQYIGNEENSQSIHYKLGLHYLQVRKCDDAIQSFRTAIKHNATCIIYWESLGDAYNERGSYNSAIRVFQKVLEMDQTNLYARLQIALIKTTIRMYVEAIDDFDSLLKDHPDYLPGLKGVTEAHIGLANNLRLEHRYGRCKDHLQMAITHLQRAFLSPNNGGMIWLWRLAGNIFVQVARMPTSLAYLTVSGRLANSDTDTKLLQRKDLFQLAKRFFTVATKLKPNAYLWYDLALCCYYTSLYDKDNATAHLDFASYACKIAIDDGGQRWQNWNMLGVINMHDSINNLQLAQHCFVQALTLERKSYTAWTNLGTLYFKLGDIKLANLAFQRAQQSSPIYPNAWIGQALIAELIQEEEEALDLFRHCQQFEYHPESALGYAHWVCEVITDEKKMKQSHYKHAIESMFADVVALDAINWYVINEEDDVPVSALSFQGFLDDRQKLYRSAAKAYVEAAKKATPGVERDTILTNLGYSYLKFNQPNEAINAFNSVSKATFKPIIGLALAYFRAGQYQESYSVYSSVLKSVADTEEDVAAKILVAMASMVYASQGEADTKTILYQCILLKKSPIEALYSACALGILHQDNQLTETILVELKKYEHLVEHCAHIAFLTTQYYLLDHKVEKAFNYLKSRVHIFPHCVEVRKVLAKFMLDNLHNEQKYHVATSRMALSTITLAHRDVLKKSDCVQDGKSLLIASAALKPVDKRCALKLVQRAIHLYPQHQKAWQALTEVF